MAINSSESVYGDTPTTSIDSSSWKMNALLKTPGSFQNESLTSSSSHRSKTQSKSTVSPYLNGDKVKLLSRVTEKKTVHRKTTGFVSSFPLAANVYKANSDELKIAKRNSKKVKKSVLTLPNEPASLPQACTVSDMNDSEYNETKHLRKPKPKKRRYNKKFPIADKNIEIYDRDARICSQLNINLDNSSTDMFQHLTGDGSRIIKKSKTNSFGRNQAIDNDVWAVLRNINKIQFIPSPPMSIDSIESLKRNKNSKRRPNNRKDARFIETCHTEEFAYISYDSNSINSCSRSTSFDRITVIGRQKDVKETCTKIQNGLSEIAQKGMTTNQKRKKRISTSNNKYDNMKDKQDKHLNLKKQNYSFSLDDHENRNCYVNKNISNKCRENILKDGSKENKSMPLATICTNTDDYEDTTDEPNFKITSFKTVPENTSRTSLRQQQEQLNGITRVVVSKGKDAEKIKQKTVVRKPRLVTTMPNTPVIPKLTQADIKRRLANIKFPVVVTGKDQVSSISSLQIQIPNYETLQFFGLHKQIWPFMVDWLPRSNIKNDKITSKSKLSSGNISKRNVSKFHDEINKPNSGRDIKTCKDNQNCMRLYKAVKDNQAINELLGDDAPSLDQSPAQNKVKPMHQFKDKVLNLFYKSSQLQDTMHRTRKDTKTADENKNIRIDNKVTTSETINKYKSIPTPNRNISGDRLKSRHIWAKARRASDFIENVIKKIKCGVYYDEGHDRYSKKNRYTQTEKRVSSTNFEEDTTLMDEKEIKDEVCDTELIPGFEYSWQNLELESIAKNQIAVKHCIANVIVQFDIALPFDDNKILKQKQSLSCIPINVTESQTKIYKYKTSIINAVLPAEICSILPRMLCKIFDSNTETALPINVLDKVVCPLTTITELHRSGSHEGSLNISSPYLNLFLHKAFQLYNGRFSSVLPLRRAYKAKKSISFSDRCSILLNLLPKTKMTFSLGKNINIPYEPLTHKNKIVDNRLVRAHNANNCTALIPYVGSMINSKSIISNLKKNITITSAFHLGINFNVGIYSYFGTLSLKQFDNKVVVELFNNSAMNNEVTYVVNKLDMNLLFQNIQRNYYKSLLCNKTKNTQLSHYNQHCLQGIKDEKEFMEPRKAQIKLIYNNVSRKRSYIKLYKKCRSTSSISNYKKSTPLQRIANLDEFFHALGLTKDLVNVLDSNVERKILSSIIEMKSWTTEITPRQALLILLFVNKKDTSNLIRFRAVILHGIAMNRITKASELDMEIEVIERENLNKFPQCEGTLYLPASIENQDKLLEELYWIAKTTASDHQKPFDKSSECLLKSLLGKRKKLNPSYLRVMARYVGLGLLKSK